MKKTIITLILFMILPIVIATPSFYVEQNEDYDLKISCFNADNSFCTAGTNCTITTIAPNSTILINNQNMGYNVGYYNHTIPSSLLTSIGEYQVTTQCSGATDGFQIFSFEVTVDGLEGGEDKTASISVTIFILLLPLILFLLFMKEDLIKVRDPRKVWVNLLARRSCLTIAVYLMTLNAAIFASIARAGGLDILNEIFTYMQLYGWVGYVMIVIITIKTMMDLIESWSAQKKKDRFGDDDD